ncbi:MAG: L,D-transpeptidase family protein [Bacteroidaceae bacterium]|nr:L,D-transpeptidase family protein [Bacteroidaceae bacterium]
MQTLLDSARAYAYAEQDATTTLAKLEFLLTQAYLRYVCGQRYGYVRPARLFNRLLVDKPALGEVHREVQFRALYDHRSEEATDSFATHALEEARHRRMGDFLREIQSSGKLYDALKTEYQRARTQGDTVRQRLARLNLERARWRYPRPEEGRYVWVNLAGQQLTAVDTRRDTAFTMKVCCGNDAHKTPLLHSEIYRVELNPYWVIPQTIVRKEIVPRHVGDSAYFARNRYTAIDKDTRREVDPASLSAGQLRSAQYILRQEKGADNSLGRIIFRFANDFSIFLHDTNNHGAFCARNRAISHGCVRVERPLDLALFMLDEPTPLFVDRIRMAIDLTPLSTEGESYRQ